MATTATISIGMPLYDEDIDAETAALIAQLALDDLNDQAMSSKGKGRVGGLLSDAEFAFQLQSEYLKQQIALAEDEKYARSVASALVSDAAFLQAHAVAEQAAEEDRRVAELLSRGQPLPPQTAAQAQLENPAFVLEPDPPSRETSRAFGKQAQNHFGDNEWRDDATLYVDSDSESDDKFEGPNQRVTLEGIARGRPRGANDPSGSNTTINSSPKRVQCISCDESFKPNAVLDVPCKHYYCKECISTLVDLLTRDESLFPLRCCQKEIPVNTVIPFLSSKLRSVFETKHAEFSILSKDRVYCSQPTCSTFLGSGEGLTCTGIICPRCARLTCPKCKQAAHGEEDCAVNASAIELRALARAQGWQTCPGCHTLIELHMGCYHMTCRCRTQFCYLCAVPWKNCPCAQWDEGRLVVAARERVVNEVGAQAARVMEPAVYQERVAERTRALRINHDCEQHVWRYRPGGGQCSECRFNLPGYLLICRGCSLLACVRCSRNRF